MIDKNYAKYELQTALLDGIFEPTKKVKDGHLRLRQIEAYYDYHDQKNKKVHEKAIYLRLRVPYLLNPQAESLLLAILKLATQEGLHIAPEQPYLTNFFMSPEEDAKFKDIAAAIVTERQLLKEAGMGTGKEDYRLARTYLEQMSEIRVHYENKVTRWRGGDWFMRYKAHEDGRIMLQLNWRLSGAVFGDYLHAEIDLHERHALKKDASKTLHRWLSAHIWKGKKNYLKYETLARHIWTEEPTPVAQRQRIKRLKSEILPELANLKGWTVELGKDGASIAHLKDEKSEE